MGKRGGSPAADELSISVDAEAQRCVIRLVGEVDTVSSARLRAVLGEQVDEANDVVLDLSGVRFIDSSGLGVLVGALRRAEAGGHRLALRAPTSSLQRVLEMTGLANAFPIEP